MNNDKHTQTYDFGGVDDGRQDLAEGGGMLLLQGDERWHEVGHHGAYTFDGVDYLIFHSYDGNDNGMSKLRMKSWIGMTGLADPDEITTLTTHVFFLTSFNHLITNQILLRRKLMVIVLYWIKFY